MIHKTVLLLFLSLNLYALEQIKENYYIDTRDINSSLFFKNQKNVKLYKIPSHRHSLRIKRSDLIRLLVKHGFKDFSVKPRYVHFEVNSPIDTSKIKTFLKKHYENKYKHIDIKKITIRPRSYMQELPPSYTFDIRSRNHLSNDGLISIEDELHRKYFFNYYIDAHVNVLSAKKKILRGEELSRLNTKVISVKLDRFRSLPVQKHYKSKYQAKRHLKKDTQITHRDIKKLSLVKRGSQVTVWLDSAGMSISFVAKALQNGKLNDIISIQKSDGKRLKARVVAKNKVKIK
jgi:flagella basal body P-ring formation protein FlgA